MSQIEARIKETAERINLALENLLPAEQGSEVRLLGAIRYAALGGGKRLRPFFTIEAGRIFDADEGSLLRAACAIECVHAYSLAHDDLPAMDDDDLRRGKATLHIHAGEAMAILAGDQMLTSAIEYVLEKAGSPALAARLCGEVARGTTGMISGQVLDTLGGFSGTPTDLERLRQIHSMKTGALIRAACRGGALCVLGAEAPESPHLAALTRYADALGLAFQITDDLLDVEATTEQTGKRTRKDAGRGKLTYPSVMGPEASRREAAVQLAQARHALSDLPGRTDGLRALAEFVGGRSH